MEAGREWVLKRVATDPAAQVLMSKIKRMHPSDLLNRLDVEGLSVNGTTSQLQRRWFRFEELGSDPQKFVPWDNEVDVRGEVPPATTKALQMEESREEIPLPKKRRPGRPRKNSQAGKSGESCTSASESTDTGGNKRVTRSTGAKPKILKEETFAKGQGPLQSQSWDLEPRPAAKVAPESSVKLVPPPSSNVENSARVSSTTRSSSIPPGPYTTPALHMVQERQSRLMASAAHEPMLMQNFTQSTALMYGTLGQDFHRMGLEVLRPNPVAPPVHVPPHVPLRPLQPPPIVQEPDVHQEEEPLINFQQSTTDQQADPRQTAPDMESDFSENEEEIPAVPTIPPDHNSTINEQSPAPQISRQQLEDGIAYFTALLNHPLVRDLQKQTSYATPRARNAKAGGPRQHNQQPFRGNVAPTQSNAGAARQIYTPVDQGKRSFVHHAPPQQISDPSDYSGSSDEEEVIVVKKNRKNSRNHPPEDTPCKKYQDHPTNTGYGKPSKGYREDYGAELDMVAAERRYRYEREARQSKREWGKTLRDWVAVFSGEGKVTLEDFISDIEEVKDCNAMSDEELLYALPRVLDGKAKDWYRRKKRNWSNWESCKKALRCWFRRDFTDVELLSALVARSQGKDESISDFIFDVEKLIDLFQEPLGLLQLLAIVIQNLTSEYRDYLENKEIRSFEDILHYGLKLEKKNELNKKWKPPPAKSLIPGAAYAGSGKQNKSHVAAVSAESEPEAEVATVAQNNFTNQPKNKKSNKKTGSAPNNRNGNSGAQTQQGVNVTVPPQVDFQEQNVAAYYSYGPFPQQNRNWQPRNYQSTNQQQPYAPYNNQSRNNQSTNQQQSYVPNNNNNPQVTNQAASQNQAPNPKSSYPNQRDTRFYGSCYHCNGVGHRSKHCPQRTCYECKGQGHYAYECPLRDMTPQTIPFCQCCKKLHVTFDTCPNCVKVREFAGNGQAEGQDGPALPAATQ